MKFLLFSAMVLLLFSCQTSSNKQLDVAFSELNTNTEASLRGLHIVDEKSVWASGSEGTVLVSTDSGNSWEDVTIPGTEQNDFRSIHAWDENTAIVFGVAGPEFGYKTIDGGATWNVVFRDTTSGLFFNSVKFADAKNGLAVSDPINGKFFVLRTEDAGNSWEQVPDLPPVEDGEANFAASNTCIEYLPSGKAWIASGGKAARVYYSHDFGKSWNVSKTPMVRGLASSGIFSVSFKNDREGIIVGGIYDQPELNTNIASYTSDGGVTWQPAVTMPKEYRSCVQELESVNDSFVFAIGKTGCDISTDGGINWKFLSDEGYYTFRAIPGKLEGFAAGSSGRIAKVIFE
ncbi:hypothetical protein [uncultured Draconibacterium sp.]|uniref:WD40/YVTN/BNR-like repeat-containing protein n=1 Tax=uncultured Draconibacterium sp. TaxID=1573823 RepID=UPI0029C8E815|nr:hypothetical protein [uncultured Draconibacterium sp.]